VKVESRAYPAESGIAELAVRVSKPVAVEGVTKLRQQLRSDFLADWGGLQQCEIFREHVEVAQDLNEGSGVTETERARER
jgi:hypothetical protein